MSKNDRLKEELAESRHTDVIGLMLGTFGFGALSVAIAYGLWQGVWAFLGMIVIIAIGYWAVSSYARRKARRRKDLIKQLDNRETGKSELN